MEIWKDILGYEGLYQVSNMGRVRGLPRSHGRTKKPLIKSQRVKKDGYLRVTLCKENIKTTITTHRVVASAFIENIENKKQVNHIDGDKKNNKAENLEWATSFENMSHAWEYGLLPKQIGVKGEECSLAKLKNKEAIEIINNKGKISQNDLAKKYDVAVSTISRIQNGVRWGWLQNEGVVLK